MLKIRISPVLLYSDFGLVKTIRFREPRLIGTPLQAVRVYNLREVDELVFLDISATRDGKPPDFCMIEELASHCFVPFGVGGGIKSVEDVRELLRVGADKVVINSAFVSDPTLVSEISSLFGRQSVVVSIDVRRDPSGLFCWTHGGKEKTRFHPTELAQLAESSGAGEILLGSIDFDGTMKGFDIEVLEAVASSVDIPVVAVGGAGRFEDFEIALNAGASALSASSIFQYTQVTPLDVKRWLSGRGKSVRL